MTYRMTYANLVTLANALKWDWSPEWQEVIAEYVQDTDRIFCAEGKIIDIAMGKNEKMRDILLESLKEKFEYPMSHLAARLMAHEGFDPIGMLAFAEKRPEGFEVVECLPDDNEEIKIFCSVQGKSQVSSIIALSQGVAFWETREGKIEFSAPGLSESALAMMPGKSLKEIISHPVIDKYNLTVGEVRKEDNMAAFLTICGHVKKVTFEELADIRP